MRILFAVLFSAGVLSARDLRGLVVDPSGAPVASAAVTLTCGSAEPVETTTAEDGSFTYVAQPPGTCKLLVTREGFETREITPGKQPFIEVSLNIAAVREQMTVTATADPISVDPGAEASALRIDQDLLDALPVLDGDPLAAASDLLDPAAIGTGGPTLVVDGVETDKLRVSPSAIREIKIASNPYSAEFSSPGRGRIEVITRENTPAFHGEFNARLRDHRLSARNAFALERPQEQRRGFEGHFTGPLNADGTQSFLISAERRESDTRAVVYALTPGALIQDLVPTPERETQLSIRWGYLPGSGNSRSLRYEFERGTEANSGVGGYALRETAARASETEHGLSWRELRVLSPSTLFDLNGRIRWDREALTGNLPNTRRLVVEDAFTGGGAQEDLRESQVRTQWTAVISWSNSRHTVRTGAALRDLSRRAFRDNSNREGTFYFPSLDAYERGLPNAFTITRGDPRFVLWTAQGSAFIQDDVKLRPNLTAGAGVRYEIDRFPGRHNFAPRFSVAYAPRKGSVLRMGGGLFFDDMDWETPLDVIQSEQARLIRITLTNPGYPDPFSQAPSETALPRVLVRFGPELTTPKLWHATLSFEQQLGGKTTAAAAYTTIAGSRLFRPLDLNAPQPPDFERPAPDTSFVREVRSDARMRTHSLLLTLRGEPVKSITGTLQYSLARAYNDTGGIDSLPANSLDLSREWAPASFNRTHTLRAIGAAKLPWSMRVGAVFEAESGRPYSITTGRDDNRDGKADDRPAGVGRNTLRGPGNAELDLRWSKSFAKPESPLRASLLFDAFNVLNRVNYSGYVGNLRSPFFGQAVSARSARRLQAGVRLEF